MRQKNKEEVVALLNAASQFNDVAVGISAHSNGQALSQDEKRIQEIVEHLQETSESKDEVRAQFCRARATAYSERNKPIS